MMTRTIFALLFLISWALPGKTPEKFDIDRSHSKIGFAVQFMGLTEVEGRFTDYSGTLLYDEDDITRLSATVVIQVAGVDTDNDFRDNHLRSPDWFDAEKFPVIIFQSKRVEKTPAGLVMTGDLTIRDVTREVQIPFRQLHGKMSDMWENTRIGFLGELTLNRRDYGVVGASNWNRALDLERFTIGDAVRIPLNIQGSIPNTERRNFAPADQKEHIAAAMLKTYEAHGIAAAVRQFREATDKNPDDFTFSQWGLTILGYRLLQRGKAEDAVAVFRLLTETYPESANAYDSLGEAYAVLNQRELAIYNYRKSLEINPYSASAMEMLRFLEGSGRVSAK